MNRLRTRLIAVFLLATLLPLGLTLWTSLSLLERSLQLAPLNQLDELSQSLEKTGRELYQQAREALRRDAAEGRIQPGNCARPMLRPSGSAASTRNSCWRASTVTAWTTTCCANTTCCMYSRPLGVPLGVLGSRSETRAGSWKFRRSRFAPGLQRRAAADRRDRCGWWRWRRWCFWRRASAVRCGS